MVTLANGIRVLGSRQNHVRYAYPSEDMTQTRASAQPEIWDRDGGLFFVAAGGSPAVDRKATGEASVATTIVRASSSKWSNAIRGDLVSDVLFSPNGHWLCTSLGVAHLDRNDRVIDLYTRTDGLCANHVTGGAELLGKQYFSTAWGDSGGGLAVFDPATFVFTTLSRENGLPTDKLDRKSVV